MNKKPSGSLEKPLDETVSRQALKGHKSQHKLETRNTKMEIAMVMIMIVVRKFRQLWRETWFQAVLSTVFLLSSGITTIRLLGFLVTNISFETVLGTLTGFRFLFLMLSAFGLVTGMFAAVFSAIRNFRLPLRLPNTWWFLSVGLIVISVGWTLLMLTAAVSLGIVLGLFLGTTLVVAAATTLFVGAIIAGIESVPDIAAEIRRLAEN